MDETEKETDFVSLEHTKSGSSLKPRTLINIAPSFYLEKSFWETKLEEDEVVQDVSSIDCIDYNTHNLNELLISSLARLSLYDTNTLEVIRTYRCNTQYQIYGGCIRKNDGRLIAAGSEEGKIFVFETSSTKPMRQIDLSCPTHKTIFHENNLVSFSDDWAVRVIDIGSGHTIRTYGGNRSLNEYTHKDYVRSGLVINQLIVSGSYDGSVKMWDPRQEENKPVHEYKHGVSVESLCNRGSSLLISVGGTSLQAFDLIAGKTLTKILPKHHKTITSVSNYEDKFLITGGLDGFVNVMNTEYEFVTRFDYENSQVLALSANPKLLAIGLNDHTVYIKKFKDFVKKSSDEQAELEKLQSGYFGPHMVTRYFHEAIAESQDPAATRRAMLALKQKRTPVVLDNIDSMFETVVVNRRKLDSLDVPKHMRLLFASQHTKALDYVLKKHHAEPDEVTHILHELMKRDKLKEALTSSHKLISLMNFISSNLSRIRHNRILLDTANLIMDLMLNERSLIQKDNPEFSVALEQLHQIVSNELKVIDACAILRSQVESVISRH